MKHDYKYNGNKNYQELKAKRKGAWKGPREIYELPEMFAKFLTTPSSAANASLTIPAEPVPDDKNQD